MESNHERVTSLDWKNEDARPSDKEEATVGKTQQKRRPVEEEGRQGHGREEQRHMGREGKHNLLVGEISCGRGYILEPRTDYYKTSTFLHNSGPWPAIERVE